MSFSESVSPLLGRLVLAWFFIEEALGLSGQWDANIQLMALKGIAAPPAVLALGVLVLWLGSVSLAFGYHTRVGALVLFAFTLAVALVLHDFWTHAKAADRADEFALFARDVAIGGALLFIAGVGPGAFAIDNRV